MKLKYICSLIVGIIIGVGVGYCIYAGQHRVHPNYAATLILGITTGIALGAILIAILFNLQSMNGQENEKSKVNLWDVFATVVLMLGQIQISLFLIDILNRYNILFNEAINILFTFTIFIASNLLCFWNINTSINRIKYAFKSLISLLGGVVLVTGVASLEHYYEAYNNLAPAPNAASILLAFCGVCLTLLIATLQFKDVIEEGRDKGTGPSSH